MRKRRLLTIILIFCLYIPNFYSQEITDSLRTSVALNWTFGGFWWNKDTAGFGQRFNPSYNLLYRKFELGLGIDYFHSGIKYNDEYTRENYLGFSPYLRRYFGKKEYYFAELFLNTGYFNSEGIKQRIPDGPLSTFGLGIGLQGQFGCFLNHKFWKNVYLTAFIRESFINRDIKLCKREIRLGIIYRFK
jgi:hypothetical protein